jgi:AcrR family transcriptional regulator
VVTNTGAQPPPETRNRILDAAGQLFAEHGFGGATVDEIARRAGVNKAMLYYYVGDKAALFAEVVTTHVGRIRTLVAVALTESDDPRRRLGAIPRAFARAVREHPYLPQLMLREITAGGPNMPDVAIRQIAEIMLMTKQVLDEGAAHGAFRPVNPFATHLMLVGAMMFMANALRLRDRFGDKLPLPPSSPADLETLSESVLDIVLDGVSSKGN